MQQKDERHELTKREAKELWVGIEHPTADCPRNPDPVSPNEAPGAAKRGNPRTPESAARGRNQTRRAIRDFGRMSKRYGDPKTGRNGGYNIHRSHRSMKR